ncbi:MAG TPA: Gfo/Idh/MocA family oxidoreductase, partial [Solirubrobacteraceae bacterium]|nr:Gfo/Idh/MocA family oxidoreductase [Solirubrobacteraceae bacterium]
MITTPIGIAVVGFGYWGPNLVRNVAERAEFRLMGLCECDASRASDFSRRYPGCPVAHDFDALLSDPRVQAVSIATPPRTHYELARRALQAGKHVMVEKPLATTVAHSEELIELAIEADRVLMPGHTFL